MKEKSSFCDVLSSPTSDHREDLRLQVIPGTRVLLLIQGLSAGLPVWYKMSSLTVKEKSVSVFFRVGKWQSGLFCLFQMAVPFSKGVSTGQTMSHWLSPSARSSRTCLWISAWTCAQRGWVDVGDLYAVRVCLQCIMAVVFQEKSLAVLAGDRCYCGFPTPLFSLHELEDEGMCLSRCQGEEFESCGNDKYFVVYQTQVQGKF